MIDAPNVAYYTSLMPIGKRERDRQPTLWDGWDTLRQCLPGLRKPAVDGGLDREEVRALLGLKEDEVARRAGSAFEWDDEGTGRLLCVDVIPHGVISRCCGEIRIDDSAAPTAMPAESTAE